MKKITLLFTVTAIALLSSCSRTYTDISARTTSMTPNTVVLNVNQSDMTLLGETTVTVDSKKAFFGGTKIKTINDKRFDKKNRTTVNLHGNQSIKHTGFMSYALVGAVEKYPNADFYTPVYAKKVIKGRKTHEEWIVKAYQYHVK